MLLYLKYKIVLFSHQDIRKEIDQSSSFLDLVLTDSIDPSLSLSIPKKLLLLVIPCLSYTLSNLSSSSLFLISFVKFQDKTAFFFLFLVSQGFSGLNAKEGLNGEQI